MPKGRSNLGIATGIDGEQLFVRVIQLEELINRQGAIAHRLAVECSLIY
jgi:hypothetical protein